MINLNYGGGMKSLAFKAFVFFSFFSFNSLLYANSLVPTGSFNLIGQSLLRADHTLVLYNNSPENMDRVQEMRADGYVCRRLSRVHECKKTLRALPFEFVADAPYDVLEFSENYSLDNLVEDAEPEQYQVVQEILFDGEKAQEESYMLYHTLDGRVFLDPYLNEKVRFRFVEDNLLTHLLISNKNISRKESYKIYTQFEFSK